MRARVLGSAAGGGFPQWNCGCENCRGVRGGSIAASPRTQEAVAVTSDGAAWVLLNASPDVREHLASFPPLHPRAPRDTPVAAVVLTSGELDHVLGLLSLRESQPFAVYATRAVRDGFVEGNVLHGAIARNVRWRPLPLAAEVPVCDASGEPTGLVVEARPVPGKVPRHLEGRIAPSPEDVVALRLRDLRTGRRLVHCPGAARVDDAVLAALAGADCVFFDGTFWSDDELVRAGLATRRAADMAHVPIGGPGGSLEGLAGLACRRVFIHLNNTNPVLRDDGPERRAVAAGGWDVAWDGMDLHV